MTSYKHGLRVIETETKLPRPATGLSGLQVVFGTAPINLVEEPKKAVNQLILCRTFDEAVKKLGYSDDFEKYTLCQAMYASFKLFKVAPVIFVNVLDPTKHKEAMSEKTVTVTNKQALLLEKGILLDTLVVKKDSSTLAKDTDYIASFNENGDMIITVVPTGAAAAAQSLKVTADKLKPSEVTENDIVGGYNVGTGVETGLSLVRQVFPKYGMVPGTILAPGWSDKPAVSAMLQAKAELINDRFRCMCLIDMPGTTKKYTEVEGAKDRLGVLSKHAVALWPYVKVDNKVLAYSAVYAALCASLDANNDDVPSLYPSNKVLNIDASCLADGTETYLDESQGNALNAVGVVTIINQVGIRAWGNNTAAYPGNIDPKDRWIAVRRMFNWYDNNFILRFINEVDNPANYRLVESFVDSENIAGNSLVAEGKLAGASFEFDVNDNAVEQILDGKIVFKEKIAPFTPAEYIESVISFDPAMISTATGGEN